FDAGRGVAIAPVCQSQETRVFLRGSEPGVFHPRTPGGYLRPPESLQVSGGLKYPRGEAPQATGGRKPPAAMKSGRGQSRMRYSTSSVRCRNRKLSSEIMVMRMP